MAESRRIAWCITDLDAGGAERALVEFVTRLPQFGWTPRVYCLSGPGELVAPLEQAGIPVECLQATAVRLPGVMRRLTAQLRDWQPAVLQTFMFHGNLVGRFAAWRAKVPVVVSGLRVAERDAPWRMRFDRWTQRLVTHNMAVSRGVADFMTTAVGLPPHMISVIPNGVDFDRFAQALPADLSQFGIPPHARVITSVGRLHPQKAPDLLLEATLPLLERSPDLHLLFIGEGELRSSLEARIASRNLQGRVHLPGRHPDVAGVLKASTALVLTSRWEGMPNVVLEAMAAGCPVVASQVEGIDELIVPQRNGRLFRPGDLPGLQSELESLLVSPSQTHKMAIASQDLSQKEFMWDKNAQKLSDLYLSLLKRPEEC